MDINGVVESVVGEAVAEDRLALELDLRRWLASPDAVLSVGERRPLVAAVQSRLSKLGHPVTCDGSFGPELAASVMHFQALARFDVTGSVSRCTLEALFDASGRRARRSGYPSSLFRALATELIRVDAREDESELQFLDVVTNRLTGGDGDPRWEELTGAEREELFDDLCLVAACDGDFATSERAWLDGLARRLGVPPGHTSDALDLTDRIAAEFRSGRESMQLVVETLREHAAGAAVAGAVAAVAAEGLWELVSTYGIEVGKALGTGEGVSEGIAEAHSEIVSAELVDAVTAGDHLEAGLDLGQEAAGEVAGEVAAELIGGLAVAAGILSAVAAAPGIVGKVKQGDVAGAAKDSGKIAAEAVAAKVAGATVGAAAGAAAGTIAYAGISGTLLQVGVALGIANPPVLVVVAGVGGAIAGALAAKRLMRRLLR